MERSPSIRSCSRARTSERGIALAISLIVAVLYFGLIELMLMDASRQLGEARRFRARIVALTLAENGAELATLHLASKKASVPQTSYTDEQGTAGGTLTKGIEDEFGEAQFKINATGDAKGIVETHATVYVQGRVKGTNIAIDYTTHSQ
jgi:hypothetical protein